MAMSHSVHGKKVIVNVGLILLKEIQLFLCIRRDERDIDSHWKETIRGLIDRLRKKKHISSSMI
jgi:hypothetical protein